MIRLIATLLLCATAASADSGKTTLRKLWASPQYVTNSLPAAWKPESVPSAVQDLSAFENFNLRAEGISIPKFIARYGLPTRYLTTKDKHKQDFLIYDLSSGHSVALYVPVPPAKTFSAVVIITADGGFVRLIK